MPKPGRPPKEEGTKRDTRLSVRISSKLRDVLEAARHDPEHERSLSDEVALRLWESFTADERIEKRFAGTDTALLLQILAEQIRAIEVGLGGEHHWLDHPFVFDQVRKMIGVLLDRFTPSGQRSALPEAVRVRHPSLRKHAKNIGLRAALDALGLLEAATREGVPNELPPTLYIRAAPLLGRRFKKAAEQRRTQSATKIPKGEANERTHSKARQR
jgi:hypothetical protein